MDAFSGSVVISIDDEMATGKTNDKAAAAIRENYQPRCVWSAVTHGVLCTTAPALLTSPERNIARVYTADTILHEQRPALARLIEKGTLRVVSCLDDWANIVFFHHLDINLREQR